MTTTKIEIPYDIGKSFTISIDDALLEIQPHHHDSIHATAYLIATHVAKIGNEYLLLHVNEKPRLLPKFLYDWLLGKLLVINRFKK